MAHFYKIRSNSKINAWSYSRYAQWKACPFKLYLTAIEKRQEPKSPALLRGILTHNLAEKYVKGELKTLPSELVKYGTKFELLRKEYIKENVDVEEQEAYTENWSMTEYFGNDVWLRVKKDARVIVEDGVVLVIDYKTGKKRDGYEEQLELYAATETVACIGVDKVVVALWFLDIGVEAEETVTYTAKETEALRTDWGIKAGAMLSDRRFDAKPSIACKWCHFRRDNGGPCVY